MHYIHRNEIERLHKGHFFDRSAMRFFKSRVADIGYKNIVTNLIYFVTSEKFDYNTPRLYTVRVLKLDGSIETVNEFQRYKSSNGAHGAAKRLANKIENQSLFDTERSK